MPAACVLAFSMGRGFRWLINVVGLQRPDDKCSGFVFQAVQVPQVRPAPSLPGAKPMVTNAAFEQDEAPAMFDDEDDTPTASKVYSCYETFPMGCGHKTTAHHIVCTFVLLHALVLAVACILVILL